MNMHQVLWFIDQLRRFHGRAFTRQCLRANFLSNPQVFGTAEREVARDWDQLVADHRPPNVLLVATREDVPERSGTATSAPGLAALLAAGRRILPGVGRGEVTATYAGLRAATEHADYQVAAYGRYVRVAGIRSTGLTASLGIAEHVAGLLEEAGLALRPRPAGERAVPRMPYLGEAGPRPYQEAARIAADYVRGRVVLVRHGQYIRVVDVEGGLGDVQAHPRPRRGVRLIVRAVESEHPRPRYTITFTAKAGTFAYRVVPDVLRDWALRRIMGLRLPD